MARAFADSTRAGALAAMLALCGCGPVTGADVVIEGADKLGADQVTIAGMVGAQAMHTSTVPSTPMLLRNVEDVRVIVPDDQAGQILLITATVLKAGSPIATSMQGAGTLVAGMTKKIIICFDPAGCP